MEILLPKRNDSAQTEKLSSRTVTVVGANGAGKSRFGVEIARRIQDHAFWLSAQKALCIMPPHEVWPGSIEAMYQEFMEYSYYVSKDTPTEFDQLLFLLLSEECRNLFEYKFKTPKGGHIDFPETRLDRVQKLWERVFPRNKMLRAEGRLLIQSENSEPFNPLRLSSGEKAVLYYIAGVLFAMPNAVILVEATRAFADLKEIHHLESRGIVDRDRRTEREVEYLRSRHVYVPEVAEVENLLMLEGVIRSVARRMKRNENKVFEIVKNNVIQLFAQEIESQALLHTRHRIRRDLEYKIDRRFNDIGSFEDHIDHLTDDTDVRGLYNMICSQFRTFVKNRDYRSILKVYNQKSMLTNSNVCNLCGLANKDKYLRVILSILREDRPEAEGIRSTIRACFGLDKEESHG